MGAQHALAVNSGTSALICALVGAGIGPGDEVLVPAYTWVSTAAAPLAVGAVPVLVDIDESLMIDPIDIKRKITPQTKAIIPVHMLNLVCDMDGDHGDRRRARPRRHRGRLPGDRRALPRPARRVRSDMPARSASTSRRTSSAARAARCSPTSARVHARAGMYHDVGSYERAERFETDEPLFVGVNLRMPELSAAIMRPQLRRLDAQLELRKKRAVDGSRALHDDSGSRLPRRAASRPVRSGGVRDLVRRPGRGDRVRPRPRAPGACSTPGVTCTRTGSRSCDGTRSTPASTRTRGPNATSSTTRSRAQRTLEILARTCTIELAPELPGPVFSRLAKRFGR